MTTAWYDLSFRLDGNDSTALKQFLESDGGNFFVVKELEDSNPHFHGYVRTRRKLHAWRMAFKRAVVDSLGIVGNGAYSVSAVRDLEKYFRYVCKGEAREVPPEVVASSGIVYTRDWIEAHHNGYWDQNDALHAARQRLKVWEAVLATCKDKHVAWDDKESIARYYIRELSSRNASINIFAVRSNVQLIQVKLCPDDRAIEDLARAVAF